MLLSPARRREASYLLVSLLFLILGVGVVWFVHDVVGIEADAILVALLVLPLIVYLTASGGVREFAAGGLSVKLREVSHTQVTLTRIEAELGPGFDPQVPLVNKTDPNRAHFMTLRHGGSYDRETVLAWLRQLADTSPVPFVIVVDDQRHVLAYMTYRSARDLLGREGRGDQFIELLESGAPGAFDDRGGFSAVRTETLPDTATNAEALRMMEESGLDTLLVVDRRGQFAGIVERDRVLSKMMLDLLASEGDAQR